MQSLNALIGIHETADRDGGLRGCTELHRAALPVMSGRVRVRTPRPPESHMPLPEQAPTRWCLPAQSMTQAPCCMGHKHKPLSSLLSGLHEWPSCMCWLERDNGTVHGWACSCCGSRLPQRMRPTGPFLTCWWVCWASEQGGLGWTYWTAVTGRPQCRRRMHSGRVQYPVLRLRGRDHRNSVAPVWS